MAEEQKIKIISPQKGGQEKFVRSNVDVCIFGGVLFCGKTAGAVLATAVWSKIPKFAGLFIRKTLDDLKAGGGLLSEFKNLFGTYVHTTTSPPRVDFPSGAVVDLTHMADENPEALEARIKGRQYDLIYADELTTYEWTTFTILSTRNRGTAGIGSKFRATTNPAFKGHWLIDFLKPYLMAYNDGSQSNLYIINPKMDGIVKYFFIYGETPNEVAWGNSKREVYDKCKTQIDKKLKSTNKAGEAAVFTWENMIKSFCFYLGSISENKAGIEANKDYVGSIAASGGLRSEMLLEGVWGLDPNNAEKKPITSFDANYVFENSDQRNGDKWITCDLADSGTDNFIAIVWDGLHVIDMLIRGKTTPRQNANLLLDLASKYDIGESHIIFDANNGKYIKDYIPNSIGYVSYYKAIGVDRFNSYQLKDECYKRLCDIIKNGMLSIDPLIANRNYDHQLIKDPITIKSEFLEECSVVTFVDATNGKKKLLGKKEMNKKLKGHKSMDILDTIAMRMYPLLKIIQGDELIKTAVEQKENTYEMYKSFNKNSINVYEYQY